MKYYCSKCGRKMIEREVGAENYVPLFCTMIYSKFDENTGKRNFIKEVVCPKKHWWNSHDQKAITMPYTK